MSTSMWIELIGTKKEKEHGFYIIILNGESFSNEKNWFFVPSSTVEKLKEEEVPFRVV